MPAVEPTPVQLSPEEQEELRKALNGIGDSKYRARQLEIRGAHTYAQRKAQRRAKIDSAEKNKEKLRAARQATVDRKKRAFDLWVKGMSKAGDARELSVSANAVALWLKGLTRPEPEPPPDPIDQALDDVTEGAISDVRMLARDEENQAILELAEAHDKPADKYQAYVAASAIKLLRDNMALIRGPRTIQDLDRLDQLIRRNLGLNARGGSSGGSLNIDISILNNTKASTGALGQVVIDAETV